MTRLNSLWQVLPFASAPLRNMISHSTVLTGISKPILLGSTLLFSAAVQADPLGEFDVAAVYGGSSNEHTCALTSTQGLGCWGDNLHGRLGDGTSIDRLFPVKVQGLDSGVTDAALGEAHTCAVVNDSVQCWGSNSKGQLGVAPSSLSKSKTPISVNLDNIVGPGSVTIESIAASFGSTCALTAGGSVICWGTSRDGILGDNDTATPATAVAKLPAEATVLSSDNVVAIEMGYRHACALLDSTEVKCWGFNMQGQVGNGYQSRAEGIPAYVTDGTANITGVIEIATGITHTCAITDTDDIKCWGSNSKKQLGYTANALSSIAQNVENLPTDTVPVKIATGNRHSCALMDNGDVYCWGDNTYGQLGNSTVAIGSYSQTPVKVDNVSRAGALMVGEEHTCAEIRSGMACWGENSQGQLGQDTAPDTYTNQRVIVEGTKIDPYLLRINVSPLVDPQAGAVTVSTGTPYDFHPQCVWPEVSCYEFDPIPFTLTLTAHPAPGYRFKQWGGHCDGSELTTDLVVTDNLMVAYGQMICNAYFEKIPYGVIVTSTIHPITTPVIGQPVPHYPDGYVSTLPVGQPANIIPQCILNNHTCLEFGTDPLTVILTATPVAGYRFRNWGGNCDGGNATTTLNITERLMAITSGKIKCIMYFEPDTNP